MIRMTRGLLPGGKLYPQESKNKHAAFTQKNFTTSGLNEVIKVLDGDVHHLVIGIIQE